MLLTSLLLLSCSTYEAQFSSIVNDIIKIKNDPYACYVVLNINLSKPGQSYSAGHLCPLDIDRVYGQKIYSTQCDYKKGDAISGYIVQTSERLEID